MQSIPSNKIIWKKFEVYVFGITRLGLPTCVARSYWGVKDFKAKIKVFSIYRASEITNSTTHTCIYGPMKPMGPHQITKARSILMFGAKKKWSMSIFQYFREKNNWMSLSVLCKFKLFCHLSCFYYDIEKKLSRIFFAHIQKK